MTIYSTGVAYLALFIALGFLTFRFFQYWIVKRDTTSKLFFLFSFFLSLFALVRTISIWFFADNTQILVNSIVAVAFFESLAAAIIASLIIHLKFPKISPWIGFLVIFALGILITAMSTQISYDPSVGKGGAIDWGFPGSKIGTIYSLLRMGLILVTFFPLIVIIFQQFKKATDPDFKRRSLGLVIALILGVGVGFIDFILNSLFNLDVIYRDYTIIILSFFIFLTIFFTQKPESRT